MQTFDPKKYKPSSESQRSISEEVNNIKRRCWYMAKKQVRKEKS